MGGVELRGTNCKVLEGLRFLRVWSPVHFRSLVDCPACLRERESMARLQLFERPFDVPLKTRDFPNNKKPKTKSIQPHEVIPDVEPPGARQHVVVPL